MYYFPGPAVSSKLERLDLSDTGTPTRQYTPADMGPIYSRGLTGLTQSEKAHLFLKRLEAPGSGEVW